MHLLHCHLPPPFLVPVTADGQTHVRHHTHHAQGTEEELLQLCTCPLWVCLCWACVGVGVLGMCVGVGVGEMMVRGMLEISGRRQWHCSMPRYGSACRNPGAQGTI